MAWILENIGIVLLIIGVLTCVLGWKLFPSHEKYPNPYKNISKLRIVGIGVIIIVLGMTVLYHKYFR
jgi:uncharacterized membrane protein YidH (DUF202 family)